MIIAVGETSYESDEAQRAILCTCSKALINMNVLLGIARKRKPFITLFSVTCFYAFSYFHKHIYLLSSIFAI